MILLLATLKAKKGQAQETLEALGAFSDVVKSEPGTLAWRLCQSLTEPEQFLCSRPTKTKRPSRRMHGPKRFNRSWRALQTD